MPAVTSMPTIELVPITSIDPESTVNVRRSGVDENVEKVKAAIQAQGFLPERAIVVRPHPKPDRGYKYEIVEGQCRFRACLALGRTDIPAFVKSLSDEEAIQQSWNENEARGDLKPSDKAYWTEHVFNKYWKSGKTRREALDEAAKFLGVSTQTARNYFPLAFLPDDVLRLIDAGQLTEAEGRALANSVVISDSKASGKMLERAQWIAGLERTRRKLVPEAIAGQWDASIDELNRRLDARLRDEARTLTIEIPEDDHERLLKWGKERGLTDLRAIVAHLVATTIRGR